MPDTIDRHVIKVDRNGCLFEQLPHLIESRFLWISNCSVFVNPKANGAFIFEKYNRRKTLEKLMELEEDTLFVLEQCDGKPN